MSAIVEWVRRSGISSSKEVDSLSSCEMIPKEAVIPNMRRIRAAATRTRVLMWKGTFPTIIQKWFNSSSVAVSIFNTTTLIVECLLSNVYYSILS